MSGGGPDQRAGYSLITQSNSDDSDLSEEELRSLYQDGFQIIKKKHVNISDIAQRDTRDRYSEMQSLTTVIDSEKSNEPDQLLSRFRKDANLACESDRMTSERKFFFSLSILLCFFVVGLFLSLPCAWDNCPGDLLKNDTHEVLQNTVLTTPIDIAESKDPIIFVNVKQKNYLHFITHDDDVGSWDSIFADTFISRTNFTSSFGGTGTSYQLDKIQYFQGNYDDFVQHFLITNRPCIVPNVTKQWRSSELWVEENKPNIDYLNAQYGNAEVTVANCDQKYYNCQLKTTIRFADFARYWKNLIQNNYPAAEPLLYLKDWHFTKDFPDERIYRVPQEFCSDWLNEYHEAYENLNDDYRFVYMGPKGSWTPFHVDVFTSYSWSINVCGEKKWILLPPGEEDKLKDKFGNLPYDVGYLENENNNDKHGDVKFIMVIQKAGDAIFVPSGWYHQVWNIRDTISINHNWVNACNIHNMWKSMKTNFDEVKAEIQHLKEGMDDWENHCQLLLKSCFGMDFQDFFNFLRYILQRRKHSLQTTKELEVYGEWKLNENQIEFDLFTVQDLLNIFLGEEDVKQLINKKILR